MDAYYTELEHCDFDTTARVLIEHSGKNFFNTVMTSLSSECGAFSMLSAYQNVGVPMYKGFFKQHGPRPFTEIKGRIDMNEGMLYMMEYSFAMRIFRVRLMPSLPVPATSDLQLVSNIYHWQSLDVSLSPAPTQAVVSGAIQDHEKMFWRHDTYSTSECRTIQDIPLGTVTYKDIPFEIPQYRKDDIWNITSLSYEIHEASKIVICN